MQKIAYCSRTIIVALSFSKAWGMNLDQKLIEATDKNNIEEVQAVLNNNANVNAIDKRLGYNRWAPLHIAAYHNNVSLVKLLLSKGADVNLQSSSKVTPLFCALQSHLVHSSSQLAKKCEIVKLLLDKGANVNLHRENMKSTPLHWAIFIGNIFIIRLLLSKGADINVCDYLGKKPLDGLFNLGIYATINLGKSSKIILATKQLIEEYMDLFKQIKTNTSRQFLIKVIEAGYPFMVQELLKKGIKPMLGDLALAKLRYEQQCESVKDSSHKDIGKMLLKQLMLTADQGLISKQGITGAGLPVYIADYIGTFLHE